MKTKSQPRNLLKPNLWLLISRAWQFSRQNIWRNKLISFATVLVLAVMIFIFNAVMVVNLITQNALNSLNQKVNIIFYLSDDIPLYQANALQEEIRKMPGVKEVNFISKADALKIVSASYPETADFLNRFQLDNPLPPSISVTTHSPQDYAQIKAGLAQSQFKNYIRDQKQLLPEENAGKDQKILSETADNLLSINNFVQQLIWGIIFVFLCGSVLIMINAIQLTIFTRKQEIKIMRLVGATNWFIRFPYLFEGATYAILASFVSLAGLLFAIYGLGLENIVFTGSELSPDFVIVFFAELGFTTLLSMLCSVMTLQNYLRKQVL